MGKQVAWTLYVGGLLALCVLAYLEHSMVS